MSSKFESSVREIKAPQQKVYEMLSNLQNLERVKDRIPEDKLQGLEFDADSVSVEAPMVGKVSLHVVDREEPKTIKFESMESPVPFNFWVQLLPVTEETCKMKLTMKAELNMFLKAMVQKPLQEGIEKMADVLQALNYVQEEEV
ncbi:MAG: SRPBCC family protein [Prevotella sp.]|nr:SRPBCC family protein [Prevotella sp.]